MRLRDHHTNKMKQYKGLLALVAVVLFILSPSVNAGEQTDEEKAITTSNKLSQSTVLIEPGGLLESGTGFYIEPNLIITNEHVIRSAPSDVKLTNNDGKLCTGKVGYREESVDLALIETSCTNDTHMTFIATYDLGQSVLVMGNPRFFPFTLTRGVVSGSYKGLMQVDAKVNYGSSGGAVANLDGQVIGIISRRAIDLDYIGLAIKAADVKKFVERSK